MNISLKNNIINIGLKICGNRNISRLFSAICGGVGMIFMLHRVNPLDNRAFAPNSFLSITPEFLKQVIEEVRDAGLDILSLDEVCHRLISGGANRRFVCFTLDDGYLDNFEIAYPIFKKFDVPFTVYVTSSFADGTGEIWWLIIEELIARNDYVIYEDRESRKVFRCDSVRLKFETYHKVFNLLWNVPQESQREIVRRIADLMHFDTKEFCRSLAMDWRTLNKLAGDKLVTLGAHTRSHYALAKLSPKFLRYEIESGIDRMEEKLSIRPDHLCFPYGGADSAGLREFNIAAKLGFRSAVTTRKGHLFPNHRNQMHSLPRVSLNGNFQAQAHIAAYLSGIPFALVNNLPFRSTR